MKVQANIQMYYADEFIAVVDKEDFERQLKNCELHDVNFVDVTTKDGKKVKFNPKYCAYIEFREVQE